MTSLAAASHFNDTAALWSNRIAGPVDRAWARLRDWNDARVTRAMLSRLSSHELDDIGLCRGDIEAIATRRAR